MKYEIGFNHGYYFQKMSPKTAEILSKEMPNIQKYGEGFKHGRKEYIREQEQLKKRENPLKVSFKEKQKTISTSPHKGKGIER